MASSPATGWLFTGHGLLAHNLRNLGGGRSEEALVCPELYWLQLKPVPSGLAQLPLEGVQDSFAASNSGGSNLSTTKARRKLELPGNKAPDSFQFHWRGPLLGIDVHAEQPLQI